MKIGDILDNCIKYPSAVLDTEWGILYNLLKLNDLGSVKLIDASSDIEGPYWNLVETLDNEVIFEMHRSKLTKSRNTKIDKLGLIGMSLVNPKIDRVILTEGVSDYITTKLLMKDSDWNVLGCTTLSGSHIAKQIYLSMFNEFVLIADNDLLSENITGLRNALNMSELIVSFGKSAKILLPEGSYKDITDNFIGRLRNG